MADIVTKLRFHTEYVTGEIMQMQYEAANEIERLREQVAHLSLYKLARRTEQKAEPVKAIGPTNFAFYGIVETDEEFAERAGTEVED